MTICAELRIRRVDEEEYRDELLEMQKTCGLVPIDPASGDWWIAFMNDVPVAFAGLKHSIRWKRTGYLARAGVLPDYRGLGLQRRLISVRERHARSRYWQWMVTETIDSPHSANNLIACGYRMYEPKVLWSEHKNAIYWRKNL